jgi:hypothetical protein
MYYTSERWPATRINAPRTSRAANDRGRRALAARGAPRDSNDRLDMHHSRGRSRAAAEPRARDTRRRRQSNCDAHSNAKDHRIAPTKQTTTTVEKDADDDETERSLRDADASVAEATMQLGEEEVAKQQRRGNLGASTSSRLDGSETSVELWDELEDLSPRIFTNGELTSPGRLELMRAPHELTLSSLATATLARPTPVPALLDHTIDILGMMAYDSHAYIGPTSAGAFSRFDEDREKNPQPSSTAPEVPTTIGAPVSSTARLPTTTTTAATEPLDARAQRREYERLRSAERRRKQTPQQRERERLRSQQRRARMTDEQKRAASDTKSRRRAALKASRTIEDRARLR